MYPAIITIVISSLTFPLGLGQFMAAEVSIIDKIVIQYMLVYEIQENFDINFDKFKIQNCIFLLISKFFPPLLWLTLAKIKS